MHLHIEPVQWIVRGYKTGSYENKDEFDMVLSMFKADRTKLYIYAAHGNIPLAIRHRLADFVKEHNISEVIFTHKSKTSTLLVKE